MTTKYERPVPLSEVHTTEGFGCRSVEQTSFLQRHARQAGSTGTTRVFVVIGCRGLLVHAENHEARAFYLHLVPEFEQSPTDELHLVLLMKDIRRTLTT